MKSLLPLLSVVLGAIQTVLGTPTLAQIALAKKYAPQFKFHPDELFFSSTLPFFLKHVQLLDASGNVIQAHPTLSSIAKAPNQGAGLFLSARNITAGENGFLRGSKLGGDVYTFIVPKGNGIIDFYYWLWCPFNKGKFVDVLNVGEVGDHVGDWERLAVRTVHGVATLVQYHAHDNNGSTIPWDQAPKFDHGRRPVGYVAVGSHGIWPSAGSFVIFDAPQFGVVVTDDTADGGVEFDTQPFIIPALFPDTYTGPLVGLNYQGDWGNIGNDSCFFFPIVGECALTTGPPGPLRPDVYDLEITQTSASRRRSITDASVTLEQFFKSKMTGLFSHILGTASDMTTSKYTIYLSPRLKAIADDVIYTHIAVKQECDQDEYTAASTRLTRMNEYTIEPKACTRNHISSYRIGLCMSENDCSWSSSRRLQAYHQNPAIHGPQQTRAIVVDDLDQWEHM